jgi:hypothetical protein
MAPMRPDQPSISAAFVVMARITSRAGIPAGRRLSSVMTLASPRVFPGYDQHISDPAENFTPDFNTRPTSSS